MTRPAMGVIFANMHDETLPSITRNRTMASLPVAARYRMIDFQLSAMTNAHIETIGVIVKQNYRSLMDHLGNGRPWDLSRKLGGLTIFPPQSELASGDDYVGRLGALYSILPYLEISRAEYVVMADCDFICTPDYEKILEFHEANRADVTMVCRQVPAGQPLPPENVTVRCGEDGLVTTLLSDDTTSGDHIQCMNMFVLSRRLLIEFIHSGHSHRQNHFVRDILMNHTDAIRTYAYLYEDYAAQIFNIRSYFEANRDLLQVKNLRRLFDCEPIYTKVRDEAPTRYAMDARASECLIADGCILEGTVENSILFRGVRVRPGAVVRNCVLMQGTVVEENACLDSVITDKNVTVTAGRSVSGSLQYPVYVEKNVRV